MIKWYSTRRKIFPTNKLEVFICVDGINYEAVFNEAEKSFIVAGYNNLTFYAENKLIFWKERTKE